MSYVGCVMVSARVRHARSRCGPKVRPGGARPTHWCGRVGKKLCGELRFPWRALYRERCGLQSQVSRRLAFELACSNTPSRVAGAVAFGRMLAYAALRLPTTSTGTYGTGVLAKSALADIPCIGRVGRYTGPGPRPSRSCPRRRLHFVSALNQPVCAAPARLPRRGMGAPSAARAPRSLPLWGLRTSTLKLDHYVIVLRK